MNIYKLIESENNNTDNTNNNYNDDDKNNNKLCLITNKELDENHITLDCNHKFNYIPLINELKNQKLVKNYYDNSRPLINQIKCPYCRTFTNKIIPYFSSLYSEKIYGVNSSNKFQKIKLLECQYINKKNNNKCCDNACKTEYGILCEKHYNIMKNKDNKDKDKDKNKDQNISLFKIIKINNYIADENFDKLTIRYLKLLLKNNNCRVSGNKNELIKRIQDNIKLFNENKILWNNKIFI